MSSITSILSGVEHAAFSHRAGTATASGELQKLFSKLHLDAIASATGSTSSSTKATTATTTSSTDGVTGLISGLRHILDGGVSVAKEARSAAKAVSGYAHGAGLGNLAAQALDKLA